MKPVARKLSTFKVISFCWLLIFSASVSGQETVRQNGDRNGDKEATSNSKTAELVDKAASQLTSQQKYLLQYKFKKDEVISWDVEHVASTKTRMSGETEDTSSRSLSRKNWTVSGVDSSGNMTFVHSIEFVDMWQKIGEDEPITYNSKTDKKAPYEYSTTAERIGKPLAVFTISKDGQIKDRKSNLHELKFGVGDITIPLPKQEIQIGQKWNVPTTINATDDNQAPLQLKARIAYELTKVVDGNAYLSFRTEILTPVESEKVKSQIMQQKTKGYVVFDIANGRPVRKEVEWNERVQAFEGDDSFLEYVAKMSEKLVGSETEQAKSKTLAPLSDHTADESARIRTKDEDPVLRK